MTPEYPTERIRIDKRPLPKAQVGTPCGQVMVILAVIIPILLGAVALGVDLSIFYYNWAHLQSAADAAVLAGGAYLPSNPDQAQATAIDYANRNGVQNTEIVSTNVEHDDKQISIQLSRNVPYYFGRLLGLTQGTIQVAATAGLKTAGTAKGIMPVGVQFNTNYQFGQIITLTQGVGPGNWDALALGGTGASVYRNNIINGYSTPVSVGDMLTTEPGVMNGPTRQGFNTRIQAGLDSDPSGTFLVHSLDDPRAVVVPMVDFSGVHGRSQVPVLGFAELWIVSVNAHAEITTYFIQQTVPGGRPSQNAQNFGAFQVVLLN